MRKFLSRRAEVLKLLSKNRDSYISGQELSEKLEVSRTTIWKYINYFREAGYEVESSSKLGYKLKASSELLLPEKLGSKLSTDLIGADIFHYEEVASTNDLAKEKLESGIKEGTLIVAERQTGGKGRLGRKFCSPQGGIWLSLILTPDLKPVLATRATYLASLAVAETITEELDLAAGIKWPNDILISGKKISGILTEMNAELDKINQLVLGIGINANFSLEKVPSELHSKLTTFRSELNRKIDRTNFTCSLLEKLEELYPLIYRFDELITKWKEYSLTLGNEVEVSEREDCYIGQAVDIGTDGGLIIEVDGERKSIYSGQVSLTYN